MKKYYDRKFGKKKMSTSLKVHASVLKANKKRGASCSIWSGPYILENIKKTMISNNYIVYSFGEKIVYNVILSFWATISEDGKESKVVLSQLKRYNEHPTVCISIELDHGSYTQSGI